MFPVKLYILTVKFIRNVKRRLYSLHMHVLKHQLLEHHSESFDILLASILALHWGKSFSMKVEPRLYWWFWWWTTLVDLWIWRPYNSMTVT